MGNHVRNEQDPPPSRQRSALMSRVRQSGTSPEMRVRKALNDLGVRYSRNRKSLPGSPDIVISKSQKLIFVHGCFWHRHPGCRFASTPKTRLEFWQKKFTQNIARDAAALRKLRRQGWRTKVIWECQTKNPERLAAILYRFLSAKRDA